MAWGLAEDNLHRRTVVVLIYLKCSATGLCCMMHLKTKYDSKFFETMFFSGVNNFDFCTNKHKL